MKLTLQSSCAILQIERSASRVDADKAYRRLALRYHPDKCKTPDSSKKFDEIKKARDYFIRFSEIPEPEEPPKPQQPNPNEFELKLTLEEIFFGCPKEEKITIKTINSKGIEKISSKKVKFIVKPGSIEGTRITIAQEGDKYHGKLPANVVFIVRELPHAIFKRVRGFDLEFIAKLTAEQAICLRHVTVPTIDSRAINCTISSGEMVTKRKEIRLENHGLPIYNSVGKRGAMVVKFEIFYDKDKPLDPPVEYEVWVTLEQIFRGCTKKFRIKRLMFDPFREKDEYEENTFEITIPAGVEPDHRIEFEKEGDMCQNSIHFVVKQKPHPYFSRDGPNLRKTLLISEFDVSNRNKIEIPSIDGNDKIEISSNVSSKTFTGKGLPFVDNSSKRGDMIVEFKLTDQIDPPIEQELKLSSESISTGCTKNMKISQLIEDQFGNEFHEVKTVSIVIQPGTDIGTRFIFPRMGDQFPDSIPADIVFVLIEKVEHSLYLTAEQLQNGCTRRMKVERLIKDEDGNERVEDKLFKIKIEPNTNVGQKFTFPQEGNISPGKIPADVVFVVKLK